MKKSNKSNVDVAKFYKYFITSAVKDKKALKDQLLYKLYERPKKDSSVNMPTTQPNSEGAVHQADLLFLPDDEGYKYALVVTDTGSRVTDAEPLKSKKAEAIIKAFKAIYKRKILKMPTEGIEVDAGSEFKGSVKKYFEDNGISVRVAQAGRHRQQASVEAKNHIIGKALLMRQTAQELKTGEPSTEWVEFLPIIIKRMNKRLKRTVDPNAKPKVPRCEKNACDVIPEGTSVRVALDEPKDVATGKKLHGKFRAGDVRWELKPSKIDHVILRPDQPPMYAVSNHPNVLYTKNQLQIVSGREQMPPDTTQRKFIVEKILAKKKVNGKVYYLVKWKGYPESQNTWEAGTSLRRDIPEMVISFEKSQKH